MFVYGCAITAEREAREQQAAPAGQVKRGPPPRSG